MHKVLIIAFGLASLGVLGSTQSAFASKKCSPKHCRVYIGITGPVYVCDPSCTPTRKSQEHQRRSKSWKVGSVS